MSKQPYAKVTMQAGRHEVSGLWQNDAPYSVRLAGQYLPPLGVRVAASYVIQAGGYPGPVVVQNPTGDPLFGPSRVHRGQWHYSAESARHVMAIRASEGEADP